MPGALQMKFLLAVKLFQKGTLLTTYKGEIKFKYQVIITVSPRVARPITYSDFRISCYMPLNIGQCSTTLKVPCTKYYSRCQAIQVPKSITSLVDHRMREASSFDFPMKVLNLITKRLDRGRERPQFLVGLSKDLTC